MTKKQLDALKRIVEREAQGIKKRVQAGETSCDRVAGVHQSGDRYIVSDGAISVSCGKPLKGLPAGNPINKLENILEKNVKEPAWIMDVTKEQVKAWAALARANKRKTNGVVMKWLLNATLGDNQRQAVFDIGLLRDAAEAVGNGAALYLCKGVPHGDITIYPLLVYAGDWEPGKDTAYACVMPMLG